MTYGPDAAGVMTEYKYNCRNQLVQAGNLTYEYDAEGNRTAQTNTETGVRTEYVVNTVSELSQVLVAIETSKNSKATETTKDSEVATKTETTKVITYIYGNGLLTQQSGEEYFVFHYNNIGSTILLTNAKGEVEETYNYGPYGELLSGDKTKTRYLYNGMYGVATDDNGLYYMRARYYNVSIKRFINQDIINGSITNSQSLNKFSYVQGNPIKLTDPFGLFPCISLSGIGHAALSLLGVIPGLDFCDAINAAWYLAEGDYTNATISMVAALPFLGSVAGTGIKWGMKAGTKATKVAETVKLGSRIAGGAGGFIISGAQALEAVKNIHANRGENEDKSNWSNAGNYLTLGLSIAGMGLAGASIAKCGATLKSVWKGNATVEPVAVSNATKSVDRQELSNEGKLKPLSLKLGDDDTIEMAIKNAGPSTDKEFRVFGHGDAEGIMFNGKKLSAKQVTYLIQNSPKYVGGEQRVILYACETGKNSKGFAQQLANNLGVDVDAPNALLYPTKTGGFVIANSNFERGKWITFHPQN